MRQAVRPESTTIEAESSVPFNYFCLNYIRGLTVQINRATSLDPEVEGYKHNFKFLTSKAELISINRPQHKSRNFHLFKVLAR